MGSAFRLPVWRATTYHQALSWCDERGIETVCADIDGPALYTDIDWRGPKALVVGPESTGLLPEEVAATTAAVRIPMLGRVESLNVGVAAAVVLYEAARQRASSSPDQTRLGGRAY
jgi:RNA methyltransferase, TrmH family